MGTAPGRDIPYQIYLMDGDGRMNPEERSFEEKKTQSQPPRPACACSLGPRRSWTVVLLGILLVILAYSLGFSPGAVLIVGLIPLAILAASALGGSKRS